MHIPDGYLSPQTCAVMYAVSAPFWFIAGKKIKNSLSSKTVPLLSIFSAFSFIIMMFNVPVPGGTTAHAIGSVLMAILLGPWAAVIGVSIALLIQAVFFGDGGILSFGANAFNMAILMPFVGYYCYQILAGKRYTGNTRQWLSAAISGYIGINTAALMTAVELGIQPLLFHAADGTPLYCPYNLSQTIFSMMTVHLTIGGLAEAFVTGGVLLFMRKVMPQIMMDLKEGVAT